MDTPELANDSMNVVLLGEFDPLMVTPRWLRRMDLIGAEDYESYSTEIIGANAVIVSFGSIRLQVLPENLQVSTDASAEVEAARDLAAGILLSKGSSGISAMGINRMVHFGEDLKGYHAIGDALTPKKLWEDVLYLPGMLNLGITGMRNDGYGGAVNVQVQPSAIVRPGVFISVNDHYTLTHVEVAADRNTLAGPEESNLQVSIDKIPVAIKILTEGFDASRSRTQEIIDRVASLDAFSGGNK
ncbi:MAG TPA: hypothetical protein VGG75_37395 [Trebonia sp.]